MKLKYTDEEIIKLYRGAADKNKQIEILADMRVCKPEEIIRLLADAGEIPGMRGKVKGKSEEGRSDGKGKKMKVPRWTSEELEKLQEYIDEGMSYSEIADRFGKNLQSIYDAVSKHGLKGKNWQIQNVLPGKKKVQNETRRLAQGDSSLPQSAEPTAPSSDGAEKACEEESEDIKLMEKCVDAAEKRVIQLSNAIADAGAAAKILHDLIRIAGSGIEDMCEDPVGVYQMMFCTMEDVVKDVRKYLTETGEEYDG